MIFYVRSRAMNFKKTFVIVLSGLVLSLASVSALAQGGNQTSNPTTGYRSVPSGAKMKFQGVVIDRNADTFTIRDRSRTDYQVRITDDTSIKANGGFFGGGKKYPVTDLVRGLIIEVEGRGDSQGELVADKIRFRESDMRAAITSDTRVAPVEEATQKMAGQMDELYAVAQEAPQQA